MTPGESADTGGRGLGRPGLLAYLFAWLAYLAVFTLVLASVPDYGIGEVLKGGFANVLPPALLGLLVLDVQPLVPWPPESRSRLLGLQMGAGALFAAASTAGTWVLLGLFASIQAGAATPPAMSRAVVAQQVFLGLLAFTVITVVRYAVDIQQRLRQQQARAAEAEALRAKAELEAVRARLDPHFLFNTLHSLLAVVRRDPGEAEVALERLADLLRHTLRVHREDEGMVSLAQEWRFLEDYLALEALRLGERLDVDVSIEAEALQTRLPAFLLQPLVENAVRHGVAATPEGGSIRLAARLASGMLEIEVADDGPGADPERLEGSDGLGLRIVRQRVELLGAGESVFEVETGPGEGFVARLRIPVEP